MEKISIGGAVHRPVRVRPSSCKRCILVILFVMYNLFLLFAKVSKYLVSPPPEREGKQCLKKLWTKLVQLKGDEYRNYINKSYQTILDLF